MKLNVFLFTNDNILDLDDIPVLNNHYEFIILRQKAVSTYSKLSHLIRKYKPVVLCTIGQESDWPALYSLPYEYTKRWVNYEKLSDVKSQHIENCYLHSALNNRFSTKQPLFSVITTTFHSGDKIYRPYNSLMAQTYKNWEWVLWDDSKEGHMETWDQLLKFQDEDIRINCYKAPQHSGYIGEMKWRSGSLCKGEWIVELDHDDIIDERLFEWCTEAINKYPDANFICTSCIELQEGDEEPFAYGDFFAFGYGSYQKQWLRGKWHNVSLNPQINPLTIRYIIGVPNHVRIWRRSFYEEIGRHNPDLPVVDDYELLLRSFFEGKWINIGVPGYYQYRNKGGNNFTFLRNSLIQYLTKNICAVYEENIRKYWKNNNIYDPCASGGWPATYKVWEKKEGFTYIDYYKNYSPDVSDKTVSIVIPFENESLEELCITLDTIKEQTINDTLIYIIGNKSNTLDGIMDTVQTKYDCNFISKIRWWNLSTKLTQQVSLNYVHRMLIVTNWISYITPGKTWNKDYLEKTMDDLTKSNKKIWIDDTNSNIKSVLNTVHHYELLKKIDELSDFTLDLALSLAG